MPTILVVEDEKALRDLIESELKKAGYTVVGASNGQEGLAALEEVQPELILLDLLMPMMNGYDFLTRIRGDQRFTEIPCIVLSNSGQANDLNRAYEYGANAVFIKADFDPSQVVRKVDDLVKKGTAPAAEHPESPQTSLPEQTVDR